MYARLHSLPYDYLYIWMASRFRYVCGHEVLIQDTHVFEVGSWRGFGIELSVLSSLRSKPYSTGVSEGVEWVEYEI